MNQQQMNENRQRKQRGFTLVEIMVVVIILGLLAGLVGPRLFKKLDTAKIGTAKGQMSMLKTTLATYRLDVGRYPDSMDCLVNPCGDGWAGPYLDSDEIPQDPWKQEYDYSVGDNGKSFILSCSADGGEPIIVKG